ncbi:hypothetical protein DERF_005852 [Dermatophagoides farinae]|uniref:Uncharacterized protein n=2 Tax=Dermatophagoides farinae TaxID=6954 RepID=A0A922L719_DERFA|nr:hypothetical protein DERF_005852 [Dermatophagoides farinae]
MIPLPSSSSSSSITTIPLGDNRLSSLPTTISISNKPFCNMFQPCGWEVFRPEQFRKIPSYFVFSSCQCSNGQLCVHDTDDMSIHSFVYRCKSANMINNNT